MRIIYAKGLFALESKPEERALPKAAGWSWHGVGCMVGDCGACAAGVPQMWWTDSEPRVVDLVLRRRALSGMSALEFPSDYEVARRIHAEVERLAPGHLGATIERATAPAKAPPPPPSRPRDVRMAAAGDDSEDDE